MELLTVMIYLAHLLFHMLVFMKVKRMEGRFKEDDSSPGGGSKYTFRRQITRTFSTVIITNNTSRLGSLRLKMTLDIIAAMPFAIVFEALHVYNPIFLIAFIKLLRLLKF